MLETYRPSGRCTAMIVPLALAVTVAMVAVGWVYQLIVDWIPLIFLTAVATFGFAALLLYVMTAMVRLARCRSVPVAVLVALVIAAVTTLATHYYAYRRGAPELAAGIAGYMQSSGQMIEIEDESGNAVTLEPTPENILPRITFDKYVQAKPEIGWRVGGRRSRNPDAGIPISGPFVYLIWLIEFGILAGGAMLGSMRAAKKPYCENCQAWAQEDLYTVTLAMPAPGTGIMEALQRPTSVNARYASVDDLFNVPALPATGNEALVYKLAGCPGCESAYLTVTHRVVSTNSKGEVETKNNDLFTSVVLRPEDVDALHALGVRAEEGESPVAVADDAAPDSGGAIAVEEAPADSDEYLLDEEELPPDPDRREA